MAATNQKRSNKFHVSTVELEGRYWQYSTFIEYDSLKSVLEQK